MSVIFINPYLSAVAGPPADVFNTSEINATYNVFDVDFPPNAIAYAAFEHTANGKLQKIEGNNAQAVFLDNWLASGDPAAFQVRATVTAGSLDGSSDPIGTWLAGNSNRRWVVRRTFGVQSCELSVQWRDVDTQTLQASTTVYLEAEVT